jgi:hypothetical protein
MTDGLVIRRAPRDTAPLKEQIQEPETNKETTGQILKLRDAIAKGQATLKHRNLGNHREAIQKQIEIWMIELQVLQSNQSPIKPKGNHD